MQNGKLEVKFKDGEIVGVSVGAASDEVYKRMFDSARLEAEKASAPIECGITVVIFGCFWLEAACNRNLEKLLTEIVNPPSVGSVLWRTVERRSTIEKLEVLISFSKHGDHRATVSDLKGTFRLRNRLAHFKDEQTSVEEAMEHYEFVRKLSEFPDHELVRELRIPRIKSHTNAILAGKSLLEQIFEQYVPVFKEGSDSHAGTSP